MSANTVQQITGWGLPRTVLDLEDTSRTKKSAALALYSTGLDLELLWP